MPVDQIFGERHTLELHELRVLVHAAIQRETHFPGPRKYFRIFDCRFVAEHLGAGRRVTLHHMQGVAMEIPGAVKPRLIVEAGHVDYQGIALPAAYRPAHETVGRRRLYLIKMNDPAGARILVGDDDLVVALNDLE